MNRRDFVKLATTAATGLAWERLLGQEAVEPIIDIHQHVGYTGRSDARLVAHQAAMGVTLTVLLPAGRPVDRPSTHGGKSNGLAARIKGNEETRALMLRYPDRFRYFANEVADLPDALGTIRSELRRGAIGIGEQKFGVEASSSHIERLAELAKEFGVPMLMHFEHGMYNLRIERFHRILEKFPEVNFIGHAQTWWGNIDKNHRQEELYPAGSVAPGGITDRLLADYPNMFGDLSARSGLNSMTRDEDQARSFLARHQDKLLFGSDCNDTVGRGEICIGSQILTAIRRLSPDKTAERKILFDNAKRLLRLDL